MFRLIFGCEKLENVEEHPSMFIFACSDLALRVQTCSCAGRLYSCVRWLVLTRAYLFFNLCVCRFHQPYECRTLRMQYLSNTCMALGRNPSLGILAHFSFVYNFNIILHHLCTQLYVSCHILSYCEPNITFPPFFSPNHEFNLILFLQVLALYFGSGSTSRVLVWYNILTEETRGHIQATGFEPIICLMPKRSASAVLAQTLAERWWDTTHTFHIAGREMTITPHEFHCMIGLRFDGVLISLEDESGIRLGADLLRRQYATEMTHYTDLETDFMHHPQGIVEECIQMVRVFLLYLLGAYLFTNGRQTMSLRWLALF